MRFEISYRGGTTHEVELAGHVFVVGRDPGCDIVFAELKRQGLKMGFRHVESGPLVRSSYHAEHQGSGTRVR